MRHNRNNQPTETTAETVAQATPEATPVTLRNIGVPAPMKSLQNSAKYGTKARQMEATINVVVDGTEYRIPITLGLGLDTEKKQGYFSLESTKAKAFVTSTDVFDGESFAKFIASDLSVEREARNKSNDQAKSLFGMSDTKPNVQRPKLVDGKLNADATTYFKMFFKYLNGNPLQVTTNLSYGSYSAFLEGLDKGEIHVKENPQEKYPEPKAIFPNDKDVKVWNMYQVVLKVNRKKKDTTEVVEEGVNA
jgi:hypothetical protein